MLIDTHAHLNFSAFKNNLDEVIKRTLDSDVWVINVGSQYTTSRRAVEIAQKYDKGIYAAVGLHPIHLEERKVDHSEVDSQIIFKTRSEEFDYEKYKNLAFSENLDSFGIKELARNPKVVAIGEIGLDYWYKPKTKKKLEEFKEKQKNIFVKQLDLAKELNLPIIFHCRLAHDDLIQTLKQWNSSAKGVIHCFTGDWEQAQRYLEMGFHFGFNGLIFKKITGAPDWQQIIKKIPLEKILIETDCPYLTPPLPADLSAEALPVRQAGLAKADPEPIRNEPLYVKYVAQKIAEIRNKSPEEIAGITTENARELFRI